MQKRKEYRNRKYLDWMRGQPCQLKTPACSGDPRNTMAVHADTQDYGKGGSQKADDCAAAIGCKACHDWIHGLIKDERRTQADVRFYQDRGIIRTFTLALKEGFFK